MVKKYIFRTISLTIMSVGYYVCPSKSVSFDNWINASKTLTALGMILLALYLWGMGNNGNSLEK